MRIVRRAGTTIGVSGVRAGGTGDRGTGTGWRVPLYRGTGAPAPVRPALAASAVYRSTGATPVSGTGSLTAPVRPAVTGTGLRYRSGAGVCPVGRGEQCRRRFAVAVAAPAQSPGARLARARADAGGGCAIDVRHPHRPDRAGGGRTAFRSGGCGSLQPLPARRWTVSPASGAWSQRAVIEVRRRSGPG